MTAHHDRTIELLAARSPLAFSIYQARLVVPDVAI
jgi:hypothetical protein